MSAADPVPRYFAFNACAFALAWIPVMYPYFTVERGFSDRDFFWLQAAYYLTMCLFEVPTGVFADRVSRRAALAAGSFGFAASFAVIGSATTFPAALAGMVAMGVAHTLLSGADAAWLYDVLAERGRAAEYLAIEGRAQWLRILGISLADVAGGAAAQWLGYGAAFGFSIAATTCAGFLALRFPEPRVERRDSSPLAHLADAFRLSLSRRELRWLLAYATASFVLLRVAFHFYQPRLHEIGVRDLWVYGAALAALNLIAAPFARHAWSLERRLGERALATLLPLSLALSFLLLAGLDGYACLAVFALQQVAFGLSSPLTRSMTNRHAPPRDRATLLSIQSFAGRLAFSAAIFLVGLGMTHAASTTPLYLGIGVLALLATWLLARTMPRAPAA